MELGQFPFFIVNLVIYIIYITNSLSVINLYWCRENYNFVTVTLVTWDMISWLPPPAKDHNSDEINFGQCSSSEDFNEKVVVCDNTVLVAVTIPFRVRHFWKQRFDELLLSKIHKKVPMTIIFFNLKERFKKKLGLVFILL